MTDAATSIEIHSVLAHLAHLADDGEVSDYLENFAVDAVWETPANPRTGMPEQRRTGRAEIGEGVRARRADGIQGPGTGTRHVITTIAVRPTGPDSAESTAY